MESRRRLRRLADLGVYGHQPGIAAHVLTDPDEKDKIVEAILKQKGGSNHKTMKQYKEYTAQRNEDASLKTRIRIARIASRTIVKWDRRRKTQEGEEEQVDQSLNEQRPTYDSRILSCSRCGAPQETRWMRLRTVTGYRESHPLQVLQETRRNDARMR